LASSREKAHRIIDCLSDNKIDVILEYLEFIKIKEEIKETIEILNDDKLMSAIEKGIQEENEGELISLKEIIEKVNLNG